MENDYEHLLLCGGHETLFGKSISQNKLTEILSKYPFVLWLDLFSKIEGFLLLHNKNFDPQTFLVENLFCPSAIERTRRKANAELVYFTLGQLNILRKLAIVFGNDESETKIDKKDISIVLLSAQDIHNEYDESLVPQGDFESFCKFAIRNGYLNGNTNASTLFSRSKKIYLDQIDKISLSPERSFRSLFKEKMEMEPEEAMALNFALVNPFFQPVETLFGQTAILPVNYFSNTTINKKHIKTIIESVSVDFGDLKNRVSEELKEKDLRKIPVGYDLSIFRGSPMIKLPDGRLVCVSLSCLLEKTTQNLIWLITKYSEQTERKKLINELTDYRGRLFEEYLKELCSVMVEKNDKLNFIYVPPDSTNGNEEVGDAILAQDNKLIVFEAKSRQFRESFKTTGDWEKDPTFITEFVKAAMQIETASKKIINGQVQDDKILHRELEKIYPVIVIYESVPMLGKVQRFVRQKVREAGYLSDKIFAPLEILTIGDMEDAIDSADILTPMDILEKKNADNPHASEATFHNFLAHYCSTNTLICNGWQRNEFEKMWSEVFHPFFDEKFKTYIK